MSSIQKMDTTKTVCVKVKNLRKIGYFSIREWMADNQNLYVGRKGRLWITEKDGNKTIFHYSQSKWANPYKVTNNMSLQESLAKYKNYLYSSGLINDIHELRGLTLGCFCDQAQPCHTQVLAELIYKMKN